jgi:hypothetical protein
MHDIKQKGVWKSIKVKDRTKNKHGHPTMLAMERMLIKELKQV